MDRMDGNLSKIILFETFCSILRFWGILSQKGEMRGVFMFQGQVGKVDPQSPGKLEIFPIKALFSACPL